MRNFELAGVAGFGRRSAVPALVPAAFGEHTPVADQPRKSPLQRAPRHVAHDVDELIDRRTAATRPDRRGDRIEGSRIYFSRHGRPELWRETSLRATKTMLSRH
jgi:hypothetical protein